MAPEGSIPGSIRKLEIQEADGGFYLLQYESVDGPCKWDSFYHSLQEVLDDCADDEWRIQESDWQKVEDG